MNRLNRRIDEAYVVQVVSLVEFWQPDRFLNNRKVHLKRSPPG